MQKKKTAIGLILIAILLSTFLLIQPVAAEELGYQNISVQQAHKMIKNHSKNIFILDVRNQSEYDLGHLYDAFLIPVYQLENVSTATLPPVNNSFLMNIYEKTASFQLQSHINDTIIVYCTSGSRSAIACQILAEHGFTKVCNMIGGINAWMQADYPIYTTYHNVTVNTNAKKIDLEIEPILLGAGCTSCGQIQGCSNENGITDTNVTIIEQGEDYQIDHVTFQFNGTQFDHIVTQNALWTSSENTANTNKTASLFLINITGNITMQYYLLKYEVQNINYTFTLTTKLEQLDSETYDSSVTAVNYKPSGQTELKSVELVNFTSPVKLSQLYKSLEKVAKEIGHIYQKEGRKNNEPVLMLLSTSYHKMAAELDDFAKLVKTQLYEYDKEINTNMAVLADFTCSDCIEICSLFIELLGCTAWDYVLVGLVCTMSGPLYILCVILISMAIAAICHYGIPPYCLNVCQYAGYCAPQPQYNWVSGVILPPGVWGYGFVDNTGGLVGISNDGSFVQIYGGNYGDGGVVTGVMNADSTGHILLYGYSATGYYTHLYVFVSYNNYYDWYQPTIGVQTVYYADGQHWIGCGTYSGTFRFIAIVAIDDNGMSANLFVDSVMVY